MTLDEIRDLIKTVCDTGIAELEVQRGENRVWIKRSDGTGTQDVVVSQTPAPVAAPFAQIKAERMTVDRLSQSMNHAAGLMSERLRNRLSEVSSRLHNANPRNVLKRGYAILADPRTGKPVRDPEIPHGTRLKAIVELGTLEVTVERGERAQP